MTPHNGIPECFRAPGITDEAWELERSILIHELVAGYVAQLLPRSALPDDNCLGVTSALLSQTTEQIEVGAKDWLNSTGRLEGLRSGDPHTILSEVAYRSVCITVQRLPQDPFILS